MNKLAASLHAAAVCRLAAREQRGQGTLEYVGIVVVAGILVTAVVDAINGGTITNAIQTEISEIISAG